MKFFYILNIKNEAVEFGKIISKRYFKFTLVDYDASWAITDKVDLTKKKTKLL